MLQLLSGSRIFARTMLGMRVFERVLIVFRRWTFFTCQGDDSFVARSVSSRYWMFVNLRCHDRLTRESAFALPCDEVCMLASGKCCDGICYCCVGYKSILLKYPIIFSPHPMWEKCYIGAGSCYFRFIWFWISECPKNSKQGLMCIRCSLSISLKINKYLIDVSEYIYEHTNIHLFVINLILL